MSFFRSFFRIDVRLRISIVLILIWLLNLIFNFTFEALSIPLLAVISMSGFDLLFAMFSNTKLRFPHSSIVSGLLIGLIISPTESFLTIMIASFFAAFSKQFIRVAKVHIFNPAAFGIIAASVISQASVTWWAVSWNQWLVIPIIGVSYTLYKLGRLQHPLIFLFLLAIYLVVKLPPKVVMNHLIDGSVFLFAFVMLPEPVTSPASGYLKYFWAVLIVAFIALLSSLRFYPDLFISSILFGNLSRFLGQFLDRFKFKNQ